MANKDNQSKQYRIYVKESKNWVDVNKEFYTNYYREINTYRKRQQEHGRCICPASKRYLCDMDCFTCPYAKAGDQLSLDNTVNDGDGNENRGAFDEAPGPHLPRRGNLQPHLERTRVLGGKHRDGAHPQNSRENRAEPKRAGILESGMGDRL